MSERQKRRLCPTSSLSTYLTTLLRPFPVAWPAWLFLSTVSTLVITGEEQWAFGEFSLCLWVWMSYSLSFTYMSSINILIYLYSSRLSEMGAATCYPVGLKQLDLSHNRIRAWPTVSRSESLESLESTLPSCYALAEVSRSAKFACQGRYMYCLCLFSYGCGGLLIFCNEVWCFISTVCFFVITISVACGVWLCLKCGI